jgi:hypothetical protein
MRKSTQHNSALVSVPLDRQIKVPPFFHTLSKADKFAYLFTLTLDGDYSAQLAGYNINKDGTLKHNPVNWITLLERPNVKRALKRWSVVENTIQLKELLEKTQYVLMSRLFEIIHRLQISQNPRALETAGYFILELLNRIGFNSRQEINIHDERIGNFADMIARFSSGEINNLDEADGNGRKIKLTAKAVNRPLEG